MSKLRARPESPDADGRVIHVTPESAGWKHVGFDVHRLAPGQTVSKPTGDREVCLVMVTGRAQCGVGDADFGEVGARMSLFEGAKPWSVFVPRETVWRLTAITDVELAVCSAPAHTDRKARLIPSDQVGYEERGSGTNRCLVSNILPETEPADSLLVVEVITPGGNWSSYPPHKHDRDALPDESQLEETYYHRTNPPQGFAFQRVYTDDRDLDETLSVEDGDVVVVPRGYHPVGAPHGYDLYYLNVMAGPKRIWKFHNDPAHEWMLASS